MANPEKELSLKQSVLELRLEGLSQIRIAQIVGVSQIKVSQILQEESLQKALKEARQDLEKGLEDVRFREKVSQEIASEIILSALNGDMGDSTKYDAAKVVFKTQKVGEAARDATQAFREVFNPTTGGGST